MSSLKFSKSFHLYLYAIVVIFFTIVLIAMACGWEKFLQISVLNQHIAQSVVYLLSTLFLVFVIWRLGWLQSSGFTFFGRIKTWLIILFPLIHVLTKDFYFITRDFSLKISEPRLVFWSGFSGFASGFFEETVFRGIVLFYFLRSWGHSISGIVKSITVSASLFGGIHVLQLAENPLPQTLLIMLTAVLAGFFYGVILLHGGSIWIPIVFHGLHNAGVNIFIAGRTFSEKSLINFFILITYIPVFLLGIYLLKKIPQNKE